LSRDAEKAKKKRQRRTFIEGLEINNPELSFGKIALQLLFNMHIYVGEAGKLDEIDETFRHSDNRSCSWSGEVTVVA
jgi:hypothetical protein